MGKVVGWLSVLARILLAGNTMRCSTGKGKEYCDFHAAWSMRKALAKSVGGATLGSWIGLDWIGLEDKVFMVWVVCTVAALVGVWLTF